MKKFVIAGTLVGALAVSGLAYAQQTPASQAEQSADKPAMKTSAKAQAGAAAHTAPKDQPTTADTATIQDRAMTLGSVRIPKGLKANNEPLPAGTYQVRLTADEAKPDAKGSSEVLERWVEFVKGGQVAGKEVVSIVPASETKLVQKDTPPPANGSKIQTLKGGEYTRIWFNKGGNYYLVHLVKE
jgi:hypothetical protein